MKAGAAGADGFLRIAGFSTSAAGGSGGKVLYGCVRSKVGCITSSGTYSILPVVFIMFMLNCFLEWKLIFTGDMRELCTG